MDDENSGNSSGLVEKLKEEICIQENKVVQLESELKDIKTSRRNQSFIPRPPGSSAGRKVDNRRPLSGSRWDDILSDFYSGGWIRLHHLHLWLCQKTLMVNLSILFNNSGSFI